MNCWTVREFTLEGVKGWAKQCLDGCEKEQQKLGSFGS